MSDPIHVVYSDDMVGDPWRASAPGPLKGHKVAEALRESKLPVVIVPPEPATRDDLYRAHERAFVDDVLDCRRASAFGTLSDDLARSLLFTCGAVYSSAVLALRYGISASLTSGFHHARYDHPRSFCTFNGLIVASMRLIAEEHAERILILDCDYHYGDGTDALIVHHGLAERVLHESYGGAYRRREQAPAYLERLNRLDALLEEKKPDLILYQAGVDVHVDDPLGGMLSTEEMLARDRLVFSHARKTSTPLAWNLAGGYQVEADGSFPKVVALHMNTFEVAVDIYQAN